MHHRRLFSDRGSCTYFYGITYFLFLLLHSLLFSFAEYLTQVDLGKEKETQEIKAREEFDKGKRKATTVVELLEKLSKPGQIALYYCGGLEILSQALTDCECSNNCVSPLITFFSFFLVDCFKQKTDFRLDWIRRLEAEKEITIICSKSLC